MLGIGAAVTLGAAVLPRLALVFVGGQDYTEISDNLAVFAVLGTVLSMLQLLVYAVLARQAHRSVLLVWLALVVVVGLGLLTSEFEQLLAVVIVVDSALFAVLLVLSLQRHPGRCGRAPDQWAASCQLRPVPTDTSSGTARSAAPPICGRTRASSASRSPGATSNTSSSWTWSSIRERSPASAIARSTLSIATLMMSAAEPWIGALSAIRSAISRRWRLSLVRSGR